MNNNIILPIPATQVPSTYTATYTTRLILNYKIMWFVVDGTPETGITVNSLFDAYNIVEVTVYKQRKPKHTVFAHLPTHTHNIGLHFINNNNNKRICLKWPTNCGTGCETIIIVYYYFIIYLTTIRQHCQLVPY